jgi:hypothetical protein
MSKEHKGIYNGKKYITIKSPVQGECCGCVFDRNPKGCAYMSGLCLAETNKDGLYRNWVEDTSSQIKSENNKTESPSKRKRYVKKVIDGFPCKILLPSKEANHVWVIEKYYNSRGWMPLTLRTTRKGARDCALASINKKMIRIRKYVPAN